VKEPVLYDYARGNLLENRNSYFYTEFRGETFLSDWRDQRDSVPLNSGINKFRQEDVDSAPIERHLSKTCDRLRADDLDDVLFRGLDCLLQRFEVTKRVHGEYNSNWRPIDPQDYLGLERYVLFAETMSLAYRKSQRLQYLNALLKSMDILTALAREMDTEQCTRVETLISSESSYVERLRRKTKSVHTLTADD